MRPIGFVAGLLTLVTFGGPAQAADELHLWQDPQYQEALLSTLAVSEAGTITIDDEELALALLGEDAFQALAELRELNAAIIRGEIAPFEDGDALWTFTPKAPPEPFSLASSTSACRGPCRFGLCCCRGWWIFCWGYCSC
jgi:hypothetical protein